MKPFRTSSFLYSIIILSLSILLFPSSTTAKRSPRIRQPCKTVTLFLHDTIYNGRNLPNSTSSAIVAAPLWANRTALAPLMHFGDVVVLDDPVTLTADIHSIPVGRAQGMYVYDSKDAYGAWVGLTLALDSTDTGHGTIAVLGAVEPRAVGRARDVAVVGGTGDFFLARGVARVVTDAVDGDIYFRLQFDIKLYDCY